MQALSGRVFSGEYNSFGDFDRAALRDLIRRAVRHGCRMAEVGSWLGQGSTRVFIEELSQVEAAELYCVDTWAGSPNVSAHQALAREYDLLATFQANVAGAGGADLVTTIQAHSLEAVKRFVDCSLDFVFLDADHSYEATRADILAWSPKVRPGGILCGHDCEMRLVEAERPALLEAAKEDCIAWATSPIGQVHPGVVLAVDETLGKNVELFVENPIQLATGRLGRSSIWYCVV